MSSKASKTAIKSPTKKKTKSTLLYVHDARIQACSYLRGFEMAVFYDTVVEDLTSSHDGGMGTRTMRTAGVRSC